MGTNRKRAEGLALLPRLAALRLSAGFSVSFPEGPALSSSVRMHPLPIIPSASILTIGSVGVLDRALWWGPRSPEKGRKPGARTNFAGK